MYNGKKDWSISMGGVSPEVENEIRGLFEDVWANAPMLKENSSKAPFVRKLEMKTSSGWIQDYCTEMYCDMSSSSESILKQAYEAQGKLCTDMPDFDEFCKDYRVI